MQVVLIAKDFGARRAYLFTLLHPPNEGQWGYNIGHRIYTPWSQQIPERSSRRILHQQMAGIYKCVCLLNCVFCCYINCLHSQALCRKMSALGCSRQTIFHPITLVDPNLQWVAAVDVDPFPLRFVWEFEIHLKFWIRTDDMLGCSKEFGFNTISRHLNISIDLRI